MFKPDQNYYLNFLFYISHFLETFLKCFYKNITIKFKYNIGKTSGINFDKRFIWSKDYWTIFSLSFTIIFQVYNRYTITFTHDL